jgi:uncharacterized protein YicC (UPF0701 family)
MGQHNQHVHQSGVQGAPADAPEAGQNIKQVSASAAAPTSVDTKAAGRVRRAPTTQPLTTSMEEAFTAILAEFHVLAELKSVDEELNALESHMLIDSAALPDSRDPGAKMLL